uniref:Chemokine receptor vGPCR3A n=1 Tax=Simian cytomegalovirus (strain Colburn) TaxID=50292 RepID=D2E314_SCMVC|nr:chemokine receptor vGPCR3A [Cercopithecine betaherpesvirus 5]
MTTEPCHVNDTLSAYGITPSMIISFYVLTGIIGFTANIVIIYVMCANRLERSAHDIYFIYMVCTDLSIIITIPIWVYYLTNQDKIYGWECSLLSFTFYVPLFLYPYFIIAIAIEHHRTLILDKPVSVKTANISFVIIFIIVILISLPYCIFRQTSGFHSCIFGNNTWNVSAPARTVMGITINAFTYALPASVALFYSIRIYSTRRGSKKRNKRASFYIDVMTVTMLSFNGLINLTIFKNMVAGYSQNNSDCDYIKREHFFGMMGITLVFFRAAISPIICMYVNRKMFKNLCEL